MRATDVLAWAVCPCRAIEARSECCGDTGNTLVKRNGQSVCAAPHILPLSRVLRFHLSEREDLPHNEAAGRAPPSIPYPLPSEQTMDNSINDRQSLQRETDSCGLKLCLNWLRLSRYDGGIYSTPPCNRPWCPSPLNPDSEVSHGLSERLFQFDHWRRKLLQIPDGYGFLTWIVHPRCSLTQKETTWLVDLIRKTILKIANAIIWTFIHWREFGTAGQPSKVPHFHVGIWSDSATVILAANTDLSLSNRVETRGALVRSPRKRGRPSARECKGDDTRIMTRIEAYGLRDGGQRDTWGAWLNYVMKLDIAQDKMAIRPPAGRKWYYGKGLVKAPHVLRQK
jgi:hypothetical protein